MRRSIPGSYELKALGDSKGNKGRHQWVIREKRRRGVRGSRRLRYLRHWIVHQPHPHDIHHHCIFPVPKIFTIGAFFFFLLIWAASIVLVFFSILNQELWVYGSFSFKLLYWNSLNLFSLILNGILDYGERGEDLAKQRDAC